MGIPVLNGSDFRDCGCAVIESTAISYVGGAVGEFPAGDGTMRVLASRPKVFFIGHGSKRYGSIAEISRILAVHSALKEKLSENGDLVRLIKVQEEKIVRDKTELSASKETLGHLEAEIAQYSGDAERFAPAYASYKETIAVHNTKVADTAKRIERYNAIVDEYNQLAEVAGFLQHNRLDRRSVSARIRNLRF